MSMRASFFSYCVGLAAMKSFCLLLMISFARSLDMRSSVCSRSTRLSWFTSNMLSSASDSGQLPSKSDLYSENRINRHHRSLAHHHHYHYHHHNHHHHQYYYYMYHHHQKQQRQQ